MEEEALGGSGGAGGGAGLGCEDFWDFVDGDAATANVEHGSDEVADHVVEKAAAADAVDEEKASFGLLLVPGGTVDGADGSLGERLGLICVLVGVFAVIGGAGGEVGIGGGETQEVVAAFEETG